MALDLSPKNMGEEIDAALEARRKHTRRSAEMIRVAAGDNFRTDWKNSPNVYVNHLGMLRDDLIPQLVFANPAAKVKADDGQDWDPEVMADQQFVSNWIEQQDIARPEGPLVKIALDLMHDFGVGMVKLVDAPGQKDVPIPQRRMLPVLRRVSPRMYFMDPVMLDDEGPRYQGQILVRDKDDLLSAKDSNGKLIYDPGAVKALIVDDGMDEVFRDLLQDSVERGKLNRNSVILYQFYVPETGMIYDLGYTRARTDGVGTWLRDPRPYFGPEEGPFVLFGITGVPEQRFPLSPFAINFGIHREINAHKAQMAEDAASAKRLILHNASNKKLADAVTSGINGTVYGIPGFSKAEVEAIEFGGAQPANAAYVDNRERDFERQSGLTKTRQGELTGVTKGEVDEAASTANIRTTWAKKCFRDGVGNCLKRVVWLAHESDRVEMQVVTKDEFGKITGKATFKGGPQPGVEHRPPPKGITIEPYSMEFTDDAQLQRQHVMATESLQTGIEMGLAYPFFNMQPYLDDAFQRLNIPGGARRYINFEVFDMVRGIKSGAEVAGMEADAQGSIQQLMTPGKEPDAPGSSERRKKAPNAGTRAPGRRAAPELAGAGASR